MKQRTIVGALVLVALVAAMVFVLGHPITRGPAFHVYADQRTWLGIAHVGDVLSNLAFLVVGVWVLRRARTPASCAAASAVTLLALGSGLYHLAPSDVTLAVDWLGIGLTLGFVTAAVLGDRLGARAERIALVVTPLATLAALVAFLATGGTGTAATAGATAGAGTMSPYVALQALGVALPPLVALVAPGRIPRVPLLLALGGFALARWCAAHDGPLLAALGVSGHSLKHVVAAGAAACALYAITSPASRASLSSS